MLAHVLKVAFVVQWLAAGAWSVVWLHCGQPVTAIVGALAIVFIQAPFLGLEFLISRSQNRRAGGPLPGWRELLTAWLGEVFTAMAVFGWRQPFRSRRFADRLIQDGTHKRGLILIHGFLCNRGVWNPWWPRLVEARIPCIAINLEPVFSSIDDYGAVIGAAIQALHDATGHPPVVVAHSMAGLAVRAWLRAPDGEARIHRVISIGTPHRGTWMARFGLAPNARQMQLDGAWCTALGASESPLLYRRFTCFHSACDNIVFPCAAATLPGADNQLLRGVGHLQMLRHPRVLKEVLRRIDE